MLAVALGACRGEDPDRRVEARAPLAAPAWSTLAGAMATARNGATMTLLSSGKVLIVGGYGTTATVASAELCDPATGTCSGAGSLATARIAHTATLLRSGKVLVAGGYGQSPGDHLASAELYDPVAGTWSAAGSFATSRSFHTATLLPSGMVLFTGGNGTSGRLQSAELFDPATGNWSSAGSLTTARSRHTATLLPSGEVLVAGGFGSVTGGLLGGALWSAELYDPRTGKWADAGSLPFFGRYDHTATLLPSGEVLVAGGYGSDGLTGPRALVNAVLYNPTTGAWYTAVADLAAARYRHTATLLPSGQVLVTGGYNGSGFVAGAETYDRAGTSKTWSSAGSLATARSSHAATLLPSGQVLVAGGWNGTSLASIEVCDPAAGSWSSAGSLATRSRHTATPLPSGKVLVAGGFDGSRNLASAELYDPATGTWSTTGSLWTARESHTATLLPSGNVLVVGGINKTTAEIYDPATGTWSTTGSLATERGHHTATLLPSGKVLVAGGYGSGGYLASAELYDPAAGTWSGASSLATARESHTATLLPSGKVLVAGGFDGTSYLASAELYDPAAGNWSAIGRSMTTGRNLHTATLLPSGKVLVAAGFDGTSYLAGAELYDPANETWSTTGSLATRRGFHTATLLSSGKVLVTAGEGMSGRLDSAELYDPAVGTWSGANSLAMARDYHTATLLPSGKVLVVGGFDTGYLATAELFDEGRGAQPSWTPTVTTVPASAMPTASFSLAGTLFTGVSEGSSGSTQSSATSYPLVQLQAADGALTFANVGSFDATSLTATVPDYLLTGPYWVRVIVSGVPSDAKPFRVPPPLVVLPNGKWGVPVPPRGSVTFTASGGAFSGYHWTLVTSTGATLSADTGGLVVYTAGSTPGATDTLQVQDDLLNTRSVEIRVTAGVSVTPGSATLAPKQPQTFTASGGSGKGFVWSMPTNASGATLSATSGSSCTYTAGSTGEVTDTVQVQDDLGNTASVNVGVGPSVSMSPVSVSRAPKQTQSFTATGGSGSYQWSISTKGSGATLSSTTGSQTTYTAGVDGDTTDEVMVTDSVGSSVIATVTVTARLAISPAAASVSPREHTPFTVSGYFGTCSWSFATNASGATLSSDSGSSVTYTAGPKGSVTDVLRADCGDGNTSNATTVTIAVGPGVSISPSTPTLAPGASQTFTVSGGSGIGYSWSLVTNGSGATFDAETGLYTAGTTDGATDEIRVEDSLGNIATARITVSSKPPPAGAPDNGGGCGCSSGGGSLAELLAFGAFAVLRRRHRGKLRRTDGGRAAAT